MIAKTLASSTFVAGRKAFHHWNLGASVTAGLILSFTGWASAQDSGIETAGNQTTQGQGVQNIKQAPVILETGLDQHAPRLIGTDIDGNAFDLRRYATGKAVVVALTSTSCPLCKKYAPTLAQLEKKYADQGVSFVYINAIRSDSLESAKSTRQQQGWKGPYLLDLNGDLLNQLQAKTTTEVYLLDPSLNVQYRGAVDDQYGLGYSRSQPSANYLADAIDQFLAGKEIAIPHTSSPGCAILPKQPVAASDLEYYRDIYPIVQNNCVTCHRDKGVAPFALQSAEQLSAHAGMVQQVVEDRTMPPWFASANADANHQWMNDAALPADQRQKLLDWLEGDQKIGEPSPNIVERKFPTKWSLGEPELIVRLPEKNAVQASGTMEYVHQFIPLDFQEERWVQGVEIRPTAPEVVHHVLVYAVDRNEEQPRINERSHFLAAYAPGNTKQVYPTNFGKRLPANSALFVQMHYTPNGTATFDQTEIAFQFADQPPQNEVMVTGIADTNLNIPPNEGNHQEGHFLDVPFDAQALAFFPHMHLRGKAFRFDLTRPGGEPTRTILDVPEYDFNWQLEYRLQTPMSIPKGSRITVSGWFDNSSQNPANPAPEDWVYWGDQTDNEMLIGYVEYYVPSKKGTPPLEATRQEVSSEDLFRRMDRNRDGIISRSELRRKQDFDAVDQNKDDQITLEELTKVRGR